MMIASVPRLVTDLWVDAEIRRAISLGLMAYRLHKGDKERGSVIVKVTNMQGGAYLLEQTMDSMGKRVWARTPTIDTSDYGPEADIDQKISRKRSFDPDLWVIEIEDPSGQYVFSEPVVSSL